MSAELTELEGVASASPETWSASASGLGAANLHLSSMSAYACLASSRMPFVAPSSRGRAE
eukprot:CAMPEP_0115703482 /NCGR_PEP_ID=MMETSP0272-20121206/69126_1 /TAXON_ID=71861 /ORGANISM="Scrippsiella trochoidea, Strain CCMP3099" /LENGTH=59 /DNA_ID=CAMNT_0003144357 /DNA_START=6 /DNA_END=182 /DNA_ORIENTATION=+